MFTEFLHKLPFKLDQKVEKSDSLMFGIQPFKAVFAGICAISWEHFNNRG